MTARQITYLIEFGLLFVVWMTFTITYHVVSRGAWRRSAAGRHLMAMGISLSVIGVQIIVNLLLGEYPGRFLVGVLLYSSLVLVGVQRLALLLRARRQHRAETDVRT